MADYDRFQWGAVQYPLASSTGNTLLEDADPAIFEALNFFSGVLGLHLGDRWDVEVAAAGLPGLVGKIVAMGVPYDPVPVFLESQFQLPLLAVYRDGGKIPQKTPERDFDVGMISADWFLPPMSPAQRQKLWPFLRAAALVLTDRAEQGCDPNYMSNRQVWAAANVTRVWLHSYSITWFKVRGVSSQQTEVDYPMLHVDIEIAESRAVGV